MGTRSHISLLSCSVFTDNTTPAYSSPFRTILAVAESQSMLDATAKRKKWVYDYKNGLEAGLICTIGATFDFYSQTIECRNQDWINLKLEGCSDFSASYFE